MRAMQRIQMNQVEIKQRYKILRTGLNVRVILLDFSLCLDAKNSCIFQEEKYDKQPSNEHMSSL